MVLEEYRERKATSSDLDDQPILRATGRAVLGRLGWEDDRVNRVIKLIFNDDQLPYLHGVRDVRELAGSILWQYAPSEDEKKNEIRLRIIDQMWEKERLCRPIRP